MSGALGSMRVLARAFRYVAPFRALFTLKGVLMLASSLPLLLLPWPVKLIVDHVIEGIPLGAQPSPTPPSSTPYSRPSRALPSRCSSRVSSSNSRSPC